MGIATAIIQLVTVSIQLGFSVLSGALGLVDSGSALLSNHF